MEPRKRVRRDTRTCYPCRKRKVKCQLAQEDVNSCAECVKRNIKCSLRGPSGDDGGDGEMTWHERSSRPEERDYVDSQTFNAAISRVELLLDQLVEAQTLDRKQPSSNTGSPEMQESLLAETLNDGLACHVQSVDESASLRTKHSSDTPRCQTLQTLEMDDDRKQSLIALIPCPQDAASIVGSSTAWLWGPENPQGSVLASDDVFRLLESTSIVEGTAISVVKQLLLFALYMQQLPASFDIHSLKEQDVEGTIAAIVLEVNIFLTSFEDDYSSIDVLECLLLLGSLSLNDALFRKAWITFRRGLDMARLKGFQDSYSSSGRESTSQEEALRRRVFLSLVSAEAYCSLLLGLEPSSGSFPFGRDHETWDDPAAEVEGNVQRRITVVVASIATRNAALRRDGCTGSPDIGGVLEMEEALGRIEKSVLPSWWKPPLFQDVSSLVSGKEANRVICHLWVFQTQVFGHLPMAFGSVQDEDTIRSLKACMEASRITLHRYLGLQHVKDHLSRCRTADQAAFVAAVVLLLGRAQTMSSKAHLTTSRYDSDRALLEQITAVFESSGSASPRERVSKRCYEILDELLQIEISDAKHWLQSDEVTPSTKSSGSQVTMPGSGLEDILQSAILPHIGRQGPAVQLLENFLATLKGVGR